MAGPQKRKSISPERSSIVSDITSSFTSVRTTITLLFLLAAASIVGTVIPQDTGPEQLRQTASPFVYKIILILDLDSLYRSWWFVLLLVLLSLNLLACLIRRLSVIREEWKGEPHKNSFSFTVSDTRSVSELEGIFKFAFDKLLGTSRSVAAPIGGLARIWVKHRVALLGFPFIHSAILLILLGAVIGLFYGFKGNIQIEEGRTGKEFRLFPSGEERPLPFQIAVDKFTLTRYPSGQPKEFRSDVRLIKDNKEVLKGSILVNHPLTFENISIYQADYRLLGIKEVGLTFVGPGGKQSEVEVRPRVTTEIAGTPYKARLVSLDPGTTKKGPGAEIRVEGPGEEQRVLSVYRDEPVKLDDWEIRFVGYTPLYSTGLQVSYDPGSMVVWVGSGLLIVGFFLTLFTNHRRLAIEMTTKPGATQIRISGRSRRLRREFRAAVEKEVRRSLKKSER